MRSLWFTLGAIVGVLLARSLFAAPADFVEPAIALRAKLIEVINSLFHAADAVHNLRLRRTAVAAAYVTFVVVDLAAIGTAVTLGLASSVVVRP